MHSSLIQFIIPLCSENANEPQLCISPKVKTNPFQIHLSNSLLIGRWVFLCVVLAAPFASKEFFVWLALPALALIFVVAWGNYVMFSESLKDMHYFENQPNAVPEKCQLPQTALISPARNEAVGIEEAVRSLAALEYPALEVFVVDDHSTDGTREILNRIARECSNIQVMDAPELPDGWMGKSNAAYAAAHSAKPETKWLLFTDARVVYQPLAVSLTVSYAEKNELDFLSCAPAFKNGTLAEELLSPLKLRPFISNRFKSKNNKNSAAPYGVGAFMLIKRDLYNSFGGHSAFSSHPLEDAMLACAAEEHGGKIDLAIASELLGLRRYVGYRDMRDRSIRSIRTSGGDKVSYYLGIISLDLMIYALPLFLGVAGIARQVWDSAFSFPLSLYSILAFFIYFVGVKTVKESQLICRFRQWTPWFLPLGALIKSWITLLCIFEKLQGRDVMWRGRAVQSPGAE